MKKIIDKIIIPLTTVLILLVVVWFVTVLITGSKSYYKWQFEKNETVDKLSWTTDYGEKIIYDEEDLDLIGTQIINYLFDREESMQVIIDGKDVFSNQALYHMADVKDLYEFWTLLTIFCFILLAFCSYYIFKNFNELKKNLFKPVIITYIVIGCILLVIVAGMIINFDWTFEMFHHVLFPDIDSFKDAFFSRYSNYSEKPYINNQVLILVLSIDVFMDAAWIIIGSIIITMVAWTIFCYKKTKQYKIQTIKFETENN